MSHLLKLSYLAVAALLTMTLVFGRAAPKDTPKPDDSIYAKLDKVVTFNGIDDPKITLRDQLDLFTTQYGVVFEVNERAFFLGPEMIKDVEKTPIVESSPIMPMKNVRLANLLRKVLARLPSQSGATFTIRRDHVEITTVKAQEEEFWPNAPPEMEPVFPLIHAKFEKKPLDEAFKDLAERSDVTIVLDPKVGEKEKAVVTASLANTPLDTAVQLLAEMSDLRSVALGKTLFVTSPEKAKRIYKQSHPRPDLNLGGAGLLGGVGQLGMGGVGALGQLGVGGVAPVAPGNFRPRSYLSGGNGGAM